jgi:hypothetical protein
LIDLRVDECRVNEWERSEQRGRQEESAGAAASRMRVATSWTRVCASRTASPSLLLESLRARHQVGCSIAGAEGLAPSSALPPSERGDDTISGAAPHRIPLRESTLLADIGSRSVGEERRLERRRDVDTRSEEQAPAWPGRSNGIATRPRAVSVYADVIPRYDAVI